MIAAGLSGFAATNAEESKAAAAISAVQKVAPDALAAASAPGKADANTAVHVDSPDGSSVSVPKHPTEGVALNAPQDVSDVKIGLPFATQASSAIASKKRGVVVYDNKNGSTTVPLIDLNGAVQINTVIDNAHAPKRYDYPIDLPEGASLTKDAKGTVAVVAADGSPLRVFGEAWAKDAKGHAVATHYEVHNNTLTQVVDFTEQAAFPVVADPTTTGVYSYSCVNPNGSSYFMKPNENLTNCKGSYIQKYINGRMVQSVALVYRGGANVKVTWKSGCLLTLGSIGAGLVFSPPTGGLAWFMTGAIAAAGINASCKGF